MFTEYAIEKQVKEDEIIGWLMMKIKNVQEVQMLKSKLVTRSTDGKM